jgi:hypothetical protein
MSFGLNFAAVLLSGLGGGIVTATFLPMWIRIPFGVAALAQPST